MEHFNGQLRSTWRLLTTAQHNPTDTTLFIAAGVMLTNVMIDSATDDDYTLDMKPDITGMFRRQARAKRRAERWAREEARHALSSDSDEQSDDDMQAGAAVVAGAGAAAGAGVGAGAGAGAAVPLPKPSSARAKRAGREAVAAAAHYAFEHRHEFGESE